MAASSFAAQLGVKVTVGMDLVDVAQIRESVAVFGERFLKRVFTRDEIAHCTSFAGDAALERMATRFAAKEATIKLLRSESRWLDPRLIEVARSHSGAPDLLLHGEARTLADRAGISLLSLSTSHEGQLAAAVVVGVVTGRQRPA